MALGVPGLRQVGAQILDLRASDSQRVLGRRLRDLLRRGLGAGGRVQDLRLGPGPRELAEAAAADL